MPKRPRLKGAGLYHHIYNRGNNRRAIFRSESDYNRYLGGLFRFSNTYSIDVISYALMRWHVHLFILDRQGYISEFVNVFHGWYAQSFNRIHNRIGHLFEARYKNKIVDANNYGLWLSRYIHRQPVEAGLVTKSEDYQWSSIHVYTGATKKPYVKPQVVLAQFGRNRTEQCRSYVKFLRDNDEGPIDWQKKELEPQVIIGDSEFRKSVDSQLGRRNESALLDEDPFVVVSKILKTSEKILKCPKGTKEKKLRQKAVRILGRKYGLGIRRIARLFRMAPSSVFAILKK